jgi:hypothetical protein
MPEAGGDVDSTVSARVRCAWNKIKDLKPFLSPAKGVSLQVKGKVHESCIMSCMTNGSETWPLKVEHKSKLETTDMRLIRFMCGVCH